jgi:hypothetical protein
MVHLQIFLTELVFALVAFGSVHASQEHPAYLAQGPGNILPDGRNPQADVTAKTGIVGRGQPRNPHTPIEDLSALTEADFAHMGHPLFPRHNVRIKKTAFCDKTVKSVSKVEIILYILTQVVRTALTRDTLMSKHVICSFTFLRVEMIPPKMM